MKRICDILSCLLTALTLFSCTKGMDDQLHNSRGIVIDFVTPVALAKAQEMVADESHESAVNHIDVLIFNVTEEGMPLKWHERFSLSSSEGSLYLSKGKKFFAQTYLWVLLALLYAPIIIIGIFSFTEAKVLGNWTGFSTKLYTSLFSGGVHHSLLTAIENTFIIAIISAAVSTLLGSIAAIGIFKLHHKKKMVMNTRKFQNS